MTSFASLALAEPLHRALADMGHSTPTPIQSQAIPPALKGRDVLGIAQTGTGKTAGFTLPTLTHIFNDDREPPKRGARVLILAPTRELASQIAENVRDYGRHMMNLSVAVIFGGVPISRQIKRLTGGNDVLVATPGRLIDLLDRKAITLKEVEVLILDEADQMLDMGFIHALRKIVPQLPQTRQTLFFSATLAPKIKALSKGFLNDPVHISVTPANKAAERVDQKIYRVEKSAKQDLLAVSLLGPGVERSLVFTRTKHGADRVVKRLRSVGISAVCIHGNKSQGQRRRALDDFKARKSDVLVATDIAARGIDIPDITHVFNFEIPNVAEQYIHRIGRTARAQKSGAAIAFVDNEEAAYLKDIQKLLGAKIPVAQLPADMDEQLKNLRQRKALPAPEKPAPVARKGRGKSKKKARYSRAKNKSEAGEKSASPARDQNISGQNRKPKKGNGYPKARQDNKGSNQTQGEKSSRPKHSKTAHSKTERPKTEPAKTGGAQRSQKKSWANSSDQKPRGRTKSKPSGDKPNPAQSYSGNGFKRKPRRSNPRQK